MQPTFESMFLYIIFVTYFLGLILYWFWLGVKKDRLEKLASALVGMGWIANTVILVSRTMAAHRLPFTNGYEFILTFCWGMVLIYMLARLRFKLAALGSFVMPLPVIFLGFVLINMGPNNRVIGDLPPILNSGWLTSHVITAIFAYSAFAIAFALAVMYLLKDHYSENGKIKWLISRFPDLEVLDELAYKLVIAALTLLTLVIVTGAIWANFSWGSYWSWDPKETWSLITWLIYAGYLHARLMYNWKGKRAAWLIVFGFTAVLFTFFGVNYFLPGLHSYA